MLQHFRTGSRVLAGGRALLPLELAAESEREGRMAVQGGCFKWCGWGRIVAEGFVVARAGRVDARLEAV